MKKRLALALMIGVMTCTSAFPTFAAPKIMSDGEVFDPQYYEKNNVDVVTALGSDESILYAHYLNCGKAEGRKPYAGIKTMPDGGLFDADFYAESYPDLKAVFGNNEILLYSHYVNCGKAEGRLPYEEGANIIVPSDTPTQNTSSSVKIEEGDEKYLIAADIAFGGDYVEGAWWSPIEGFVRKDYSFDPRYHQLKAWIISTVLENQGAKDLEVEAPYSYLINSTEESIELTNMTKNLAVDLMKEGHCKNIKMNILPVDRTIMASVVGREWYHKC